MPYALTALGVLAFLLVGCTAELPDAERGFDEHIASLTEEIRIDGYSEDLVPIGGIAVDEDGTIALLQVQDGMVRLFSSQGDAVGAFGRQGEGPGEFQNPNQLGWWADTLWVLDERLRRLSVISPEMELSRTVLFTNSLTPLLAFTQDEKIVGLLSGEIVRLSWSQQVEAPLIVLPPEERTSANVPGVMVLYGIPFGNSPQWGVSPQGEVVAVAMAVIEGPDVGTFGFVAVDLEGDTIIDRRFEFHPEPIASEDGQRAWDERIATYETMGPEAVAAMRSAVHVPAVYPPFTGLLVGSDHTYWLERREHEDRRSYYVISSDGRPIGTLTLPLRSRLAAAQLSKALVIEADEVGVQSVIRYGLDWELSTPIQ